MCCKLFFLIVIVYLFLFYLGQFLFVRIKLISEQKRVFHNLSNQWFINLS